MIQRAAVSAVCGLLAAGAVAAGTSKASGATAPSWRIVQTLGPPANGDSQMSGITATDASDAWAVGSLCTNTQSCSFDLSADQWDGSSWSAMPVPDSMASQQNAYAIGATSADNVWAFGIPGGSSYADHWTGSAWTSAATPGSCTVDSTAVFSTTDVWAFGQCNGPAIYTREYNGTGWVNHPAPVDTFQPGMVSAVNRNEIWAVGPAASQLPNTVRAAEWTGAKWKTITIGNLHLAKNTALDPDTISVSALASNNVWIFAGLQKDESHAGWVQVPGSVLAHWDGQTWTRVTVPYPVEEAGPFTPDGQGGLWLSAMENTTGYPTVFFHYSAGTWTRRMIPAPDGQYTWLTALDLIPGTTSIWATGLTQQQGVSAAQGVILKYGT